MKTRSVVDGCAAPSTPRTTCSTFANTLGGPLTTSVFDTGSTLTIVPLPSGPS
ncbi:MAG: hypothetical protein LW806_03225 [Planctomycetaceae bacterium]|nr:hypothetical protein [Planctomycetaceae bacterium]